MLTGRAQANSMDPSFVAICHPVSPSDRDVVPGPLSFPGRLGVAAHFVRQGQFRLLSRCTLPRPACLQTATGCRMGRARRHRSSFGGAREETTPTDFSHGPLWLNADFAAVGGSPWSCVPARAFAVTGSGDRVGRAHIALGGPVSQCSVERLEPATQFMVPNMDR